MLVVGGEEFEGLWKVHRFRLRYPGPRDFDLFGFGPADGERIARVFRQSRAAIVDDGIAFDPGSGRLVTSGSLPTGHTLSTASGMSSGTPTTRTTSTSGFTLTATDECSLMAIQPIAQPLDRSCHECCRGAEATRPAWHVSNLGCRCRAHQ